MSNNNEGGTQMPAYRPDQIEWRLKETVLDLRRWQPRIPDNAVKECLDIAIGALLHAQRELAFAEIQQSTGPLTNAEIDKLIAKNPDRWTQFRGKGIA
jgi:hypothetical protein